MVVRTHNQRQGFTNISDYQISFFYSDVCSEEVRLFNLIFIV